MLEKNFNITISTARKHIIEAREESTQLKNKLGH